MRSSVADLMHWERLSQYDTTPDRSLHQVQERILQERVRQLRQAQPWLDKATNQLYGAFIQRFELEALKKMGMVVHAALPAELHKLRISPAESHDQFAFECALDRYMAEYLRRSANNLPAALRALALELHGGQVDIQNLVLLFRMVERPREASVNVEAVWLHGNTISKRQLSNLLRLGSAAHIVPSLPLPWRTVLHGAQYNSPSAREHRLRSFYFRTLHRAFNDYGAPWKAVVAFPFLQEFELRNALLLSEARYLSIPFQELGALVIGAGYVSSN